MNITHEELIMLENARSEKEWNDICDIIKTDRNGLYPENWYETVIIGGVFANVSSGW